MEEIGASHRDPSQEDVSNGFGSRKRSTVVGNSEEREDEGGPRNRQRCSHERAPLPVPWAEVSWDGYAKETGPLMSWANRFS